MRGENVSGYIMNSDSATALNMLDSGNAGNGSGLRDPTGAYDPGMVSTLCNRRPRQRRPMRSNARMPRR